VQRGAGVGCRAAADRVAASGLRASGTFDIRAVTPYAAGSKCSRGARGDRGGLLQVNVDIWDDGRPADVDVADETPL
jgi:hypothetical protein